MMRRLAMALLVGWALACASSPAPEPPSAPSEPSAPVESLGGITQGAPLDPSGFACAAGRCTKAAEVAGLQGTLIVTLCGDLVHQVAFQGTFHSSAAAAEALAGRGRADAMAWTSGLRDALTATGWRLVDPTEVEAKGLAERVGGAQRTAAGRELDEPFFIYLEHDDGRRRIISGLELPDPAAELVDPTASKVEITLSTLETAPCTSGL